MASPLGLAQPGNGKVRTTANLRLSIMVICPASLSMLTKIWPLPSSTANSGLSGTAKVATTSKLEASSTVTSLLLPLNVNTCLPTGSYKMASGLCAAIFTSRITAKLSLSNIVTESALPLLV